MTDWIVPAVIVWAGIMALALIVAGVAHGQGDDDAALSCVVVGLLAPIILAAVPLLLLFDIGTAIGKRWK